MDILVEPSMAVIVCHTCYTVLPVLAWQGKGEEGVGVIDTIPTADLVDQSCKTIM